MSTTTAALPSRTRWARVVAVGLGLALVGLAVRLWAIGVPDLTEDEELSTALPLVSYAEIFYNIGDRPPLPFLAQKMAVTLTGSAEAGTLRVPSAIAGAVTILVLVLLAYRVSGLGAATIAGLLLGLSHFHFEWSRDARYYPMFGLTSLLFIWCFWEGVRQPRPRCLLLAIPVALATVWSHHAGSLVIAACGLTVPGFVCAPEWRRWIHSHRWAAIGGAAVLTGALSVVFGKAVEQAKHMLDGIKAGNPLTENFDIAPAYLAHRLAEVLAIPQPLLYMAVPLIGLGLVLGFLRWRAFAAIITAAVAVPFALVWVFRPPIVFHPKYFIFMLPLLYIAAAWGILGIGNCLVRLGRRLGHGAGAYPASLLVQGAMALLILVPNVYAIGLDYRHPRVDLQRAAADVSAWAHPGETLGYTFSGHERLFPHYLQSGLRLKTGYVDPQQPIRWDIAHAPSTWFIHLGKTHTSQDIAAFLLSSRFSRAAYHQAFVVHGPNIQRIEFGQNHPGWPSPEGPLQLRPAASAQLDVLVPRAGRRAILAYQARPDAQPVSLAVQPGSLPGVGLTLAGPGTYWGIADAPYGRIALSIHNETPDRFALLSAVEILPVLENSPLDIPCWDFYAAEGGRLDTLWIEREKDRILVRDLRGNAILYYRFFCAEPGQAAVRVTALGDPPLANRYAITLPGVAGAENMELEFAPSHRGPSTQTTPAVQLQRGVYTMALQYLDLSGEQKAALTRNFTVQSPERIQSCGIERITLVPVNGEADAESGP